MQKLRNAFVRCRSTDSTTANWAQTGPLIDICSENHRVVLRVADGGWSLDCRNHESNSHGTLPGHIDKR